MQLRFYVGLASLSFLTGCFFALAPAREAEVAQVQAAIDAKDYPKLKDFCLKKKGSTGSLRDASDRACDTAYKIAEEKEDVDWLKSTCAIRDEDGDIYFDEACDHLQTIALKKNDMAMIQYVCETTKDKEACRIKALKSSLAELAKADCSTLSARVTEARKGDLNRETTRPEELAPVVAALAKCGDGKIIFEDIADEGIANAEAYGAQVLFETEKLAGPELYSAFEKYMKEHPGAKFLNGKGSAANHVRHWLLRAKRNDLCKPFVSLLKDAPEEVVAHMLYYFNKVECKEGAPYAVTLLASDKPQTRMEACATLGAVGNKSHLAKLTAIAENDTTSQTVERPEGSGNYVKELYVAEECKGAIGKIKVRGK
jgi:hypothetical protein